MSFKVEDVNGIGSDIAAIVTFNVLPVNDSPVADAGEDQEVYAGDAVQLDGSASTDVEDAELSYEWIGDGISPLSGGTPTFDAPSGIESLVLTLTVTDSGGLTATDMVTITITVANESPVAASQQPVSYTHLTLPTICSV